MKFWQNVTTLGQISALATLSIATIHYPTIAQESRVECWRYVVDLGASKERADSICADEPNFAGFCAEKVRDTGGTWDRAESLCKNGTTFSGECFQSVIDGGGNWDTAESLCKNALANTGLCIQQGLNEGFSWKRISSDCRNPSVAEALQECMNGIMYDSKGKPTGISESAALEECRRTRPNQP